MVGVVLGMIFGAMIGGVFILGTFVAGTGVFGAISRRHGYLVTILIACVLMQIAYIVPCRTFRRYGSQCQREITCIIWNFQRPAFLQALRIDINGHRRRAIADGNRIALCIEQKRPCRNIADGDAGQVFTAIRIGHRR